MGGDTYLPCLRMAAVEVQGVPFCELCAREQEIYFEIGELTQEQMYGRAKQDRGYRDRLLAVALNRVKRLIGGRTGRAETRPEAVKR